MASLPVSKASFTNYITWGEEQLKRLGVDVRKNTEATAGLVDSLKPDTVFVATGSQPAEGRG